MTMTPAMPRASCTTRARLRCSCRKSAASSAVHTGMVNSIANTVASVSAPSAYIQHNWPPTCTSARAAWSGSRRVAIAPTPWPGISRHTMASVTAVRSARISSTLRWRLSSRTAIAIAAKENTAPSIHRTPRRACGCAVIGNWETSLCYLPRPMAADAGRDDLYRAQIARLFQRSPFYREKLGAAGFVSPADVGGLVDIARLPFTEKDELRASQAAHAPLGAHAAIDASQAARIYSTSGTSGTPLYIPLSRADLEQWREIGRRTYSCNGLAAGERVVTTYGAGPFVAGASLAAFEAIGCVHIPVGVGNTDRLLTAIQKLAPEALACTPSYALHIAELAASKGVSLGAVKRIIVGGEPGGGEEGFRRK